LQAIEKWSNTPARDGVLRVGLVWRGNPEHDNDRNRSLSLAALGPLLESKNCEFVSLQWDLSEEEQRVIAAHPNMNNPRPKIASFDDTAALMAHLDLVISVDTAVAHLAGALGRNVWILLPFAPDWRWMLDRADSPWYPTARIFRQSQRGQWNPVVEEVTSLLRKICESRATPANA
jgi:ADP-heptose:LPS heptosyltransferase